MIQLRILPMALAALLLSFQASVWAETNGVVLTDDVQMALGDAFLAEGEYYRAVTEYKKLTILFPDSDRLPEALFKIGMAYYRGEDYATAAEGFAKVRQTYAADYFSRAAFYEGLSYSRLGRHDAAALAFERAQLFDRKHPAAADAQLGQSLNAFERDDTSGCRTELEAFIVNYPEDERAPAVMQAFALLDEYDAVPPKSPALAGTLSALFPGSGQVYAEHYRDGAMAFIVNALFIAGTVAAVDAGNYPLAVIAGGVGLPFYVGNIYGAANAARKWNLSLKNDMLNQISFALRFDFSVCGDRL
jgi:tetratricopeptide (TPR) repeat protein